MNGHFLISKSTDDQVYSNLVAGNGESIFTHTLTEEDV